MNRFKHINTTVLTSNLDFSKVEKPYTFKGNADLSVSVGIPKNLEENKRIRCEAMFKFGSEEETIKINMTSLSFFEIEAPIEEQTLREDANKICSRLAVEELAQKIARITELHVGKALNIPIPNDE